MKKIHKMFHWVQIHFLKAPVLNPESGFLSLYSDGLRAGEPVFDSRQGPDFSLLHIVQTGSGAHAASYPVGTRVSFPRGKPAGA
jgi:hypothetical protein